MWLALLTIFFTSFIIALSGAIVPGPMMTVTISESSHRGAMTGPKMIFGHSILELVLVLALLSGLAPLLIRDDVFIIISLCGGTILLWMGISMLRSIPSLQLEKQPTTKKQQNLIVAGAVLSAINPYFLIWWASIGLGYIMHSLKFGLMGVAAFFIGHTLADLAWYALLSAGIAKGKRFLSDLIYKRLITCCSIFLIIFSCYFFFSGIHKLFIYT